MKKKHKSTDKDLRKIFGKESKPTVCPECGEELFGTGIDCGFECSFGYICFKCPREVIIGSKSGMTCNKKLSRNELIKIMAEFKGLGRENAEELIKKSEEYYKVSY